MDYSESYQIVKDAAYEYIMNPDIEVCYDTFYDSIMGEESGELLLPHYIRCRLQETPEAAVIDFCDIIEEVMEFRLSADLIYATADLIKGDRNYILIAPIFKRFKQTYPHMHPHTKNDMCNTIKCGDDGTIWQRAGHFVVGDRDPYSNQSHHTEIPSPYIFDEI